MNFELNLRDWSYRQWDCPNNTDQSAKFRAPINLVSQLLQEIAGIRTKILVGDVLIQLQQTLNIAYLKGRTLLSQPGGTEPQIRQLLASGRPLRKTA